MPTHASPGTLASTSTLFPIDDFVSVDAAAASVRDDYLISYRGHTLTGYRTDLRIWFTWCEQHGIPVLAARRVHIETFDREMEQAGRRPATRQRRLSAIRGYYRYAEQEDIIAKSPGQWVRMPKVSQESTSAYLDRFELGRFLVAADRIGRPHAALACLLTLNGLRVSEAVGSDIEGLAFAGGHRTLAIVRKGGKEADVPLAPRTFRAVLAAVDERTSGPILLNTLDGRMSRHSASRAIHRVAVAAGIGKSIGPHACRHTFISTGLDAGVPLRDMQTAAGHASVTTTVRYDRRAANLDRHAAYVVAAFAGGG